MAVRRVAFSNGLARLGLAKLLLAAALFASTGTGRSQPILPADAKAERIAGIIGESRTPDAELPRRALSAAAVSDLLPADRFELLDAAVATLGENDDAGIVLAALAQRQKAYLASRNERDLRWVELVEDQVNWLLAHGRGAEARVLQEEAVSVAEAQLGERSPALLPHLRLLSRALEAADATPRDARMAARRIARVGDHDTDLLAPAATMGISPASAGPNAVEKVRVFYATNRLPAAPDAWFGDRYFSSRPGPLRLGIAEVWVPPRSADPVARGALWGFEVPPARLKETVLTRLIALDDSARFRALLRRDAARGKEILIYVHGYNVSFSDSVRTAANLAVDLDVRGPSLVYSWPSAGSLLGYWRDGTVIADPSNRLAEQLEGLIANVATDNPDARIFVLAHSMGNRVALQALAQLAAARPATRLAGVVLASPDVPKAGYDANASAAARISRRLTLYASSNDMALRLSTILNRDVRAGSPYSLGPGSPGEKVDTTLDATLAAGLSPDYLGHSDYLRGALVDLRSLLWSDLPASRRCILHANRGYFAFKGAECTLSDYSDAFVAVRRLGSKERALQFAAENAQVTASDTEARRWARVGQLIRTIF